LAHFNRLGLDRSIELPDLFWALPSDPVLLAGHRLEVSVARDTLDGLLWHVDISVVPMEEIIAEAVAQMFPSAWRCMFLLLRYSLGRLMI
jgi:hypothetical protein